MKKKKYTPPADQTTKWPKPFRLFWDVFSQELWTLFKLNLFFLLCCIPVFTIGPALSALTHVIARLIRSNLGEEKAGKLFLRVFKNNFRSALPWGIVVLVLNLALIWGLLFYGSLAVQSMFFIPLMSLCLLGLVAVWATSIHLFPLLSDEPGEGPLKRAVMLSFEKLPRTMIALMLTWIVLGAQILTFPASIPVTIIIGLSLPALISGLAYTDREDLEDDR